MLVEKIIPIVIQLIDVIVNASDKDESAKPADPVKSEHERFMDETQRTHLDFSHVFDEQVREDNRRQIEEQFRQTSNLF